MIGTTLLDRYRIDAELGRGGVGVVYRARDLFLEREVAVKILEKSAGGGLDTEARARLLHEARAAAQLNHPNIVTVFDAGQSGEVHFIIMELVEGESLQDHRPDSLAEALSISQQVCAALQHAHAHGIIHRDLKPGNVILATDGTAKLTDFGLARSIASHITLEGKIVGTVFYLPPEQAMGKEVDARTDLYALGVMLYELVAGRLPFTADEPLAVISQHLYAPVVPPSTYRPDLPPALEKLILKLLAKDPQERYASADEVRIRLEQIEGTSRTGELLTTEEEESTETILLLEKLARGRLVGRQGEIGQLRELWRHVQGGRSLLVLLSGEPGVGKTRLAREMLVYTRLSGGLVLKGGCYEYEAATPYLPLVEALGEWVREQSPEALRDHLGPLAPELARLAPELESKIGPLAPNPPLAPNEERLRFFDHVSRFLQSLASQGGLLLFIDDMHWVDQGTLALLHYVLRNLRSAPVMVLAAYREIELDRAHPFSAALVEWNRERLAMRIQLGRLSKDEVGQFLASLFGISSVSEEFVQAVYRETEGNPFFVEEVIKSLIEGGQVYRVDGRWERQDLAQLTIPQSIKEAIGRRLNQLSAPCMDVLHLAAVLGKRFSFSELVASAPMDEETLLDALDEANVAQLIRPEGAEAFAFTHDKIREVLYEELNPIRRRRLHKRIGEGLEKLYIEAAPHDKMAGHVQDLAYHFVESGELEKGLKYSLQAAEQASKLHAFGEAIHQYTHAVECAETLNLPQQLAEIYQAMGNVYALAGPLQSAVENYQRALDLTGFPQVKAELKVNIGEAYASVGDGRGLEFLESALQELDPQAQSHLIARATANIGRFHHLNGEWDQAITYLEKARALAEPLEDAVALTYIYSYLSGAYQNKGNVEESLSWAQRCIDLGENKGIPQAIAVGYEFIAEDMDMLGEWHKAMEAADLDYEYGQRIGWLERMAWADASRANAHYGLGNLKGGLEKAASALAMAEQLGLNRLMAFIRSNRSTTLAALGDYEAAQTDAEFVLAQAVETGMRQIYGWAYQSFGTFHIYRRDWDQLLYVYQAAQEHGFQRQDFLYVAWLGKGLSVEIQQALQELPIDEIGGSPYQKAIVWRWAGQCYSLLGNPHEALRLLDKAIALFEAGESRLELAKALLDRSKVYQALGKMDSACKDAQQACDLFKDCGAQPGATEAQEWLERYGCDRQPS